MTDIEGFMREAIRAFRLGIICEGSQALKHFVDEIVPLMEQSEATLSEIDIIIMKELLTAQERGDFNFVADILEYEFTKSSLWKTL